ncbi:MAG: hypothetical protein AAF747_11685 [Planctomycetota bacterium]
MCSALASERSHDFNFPNATRVRLNAEPVGSHRVAMHISAKSIAGFEARKVEVDRLALIEAALCGLGEADRHGRRLGIHVDYWICDTSLPALEAAASAVREQYDARRHRR